MFQMAALHSCITKVLLRSDSGGGSLPGKLGRHGLLSTSGSFDDDNGFEPQLHMSISEGALKYTNAIRKAIPRTLAPKRIKYLGINLTKEVKYLYAENYKYC